MIWKEVKLSEVAIVAAGQSAPKEHFFNDSEGLPFIRAGHLEALIKGASQYDLPRISKVEANKAKLKTLPANTVLFAKSGMSATLDRVYLTELPSYYVSHLASITPKNGNLHPTFCKYFFQWYKPSRLIKDAAYPSISLEDINNIRFKLPPFPVQQKISEILDRADALRREDKQLLKKYDELLLAVYNEMFVGKVNVVKEIKPRFLFEIAEIVSGVAKNSNVIKDDFIKVPYMRVANVQDGHIDLKEVKTIFASQNDFNKYQLKKGDILLTEGGDPDKLGRGAVWNGEIEPCIHQNHIFRVRLTAKEIHPTYLSYHLSSVYGKSYFLMAAKQTTGIASINLRQLRSFKAHIPDWKLQLKFVDAINEIEKQYQIAELQVSMSEYLFQALLQKAFRGELVNELQETLCK